MFLKIVVKKITPRFVVAAYHYCLAWLAGFWYGWPSKQMLIIGVTGTKGKTSTCNFIHSVLTAGGYKTGLLSTANIKIGQEEMLNHFHMTMPGRFALQKFLFQMAKAGCCAAVIETSSEGIRQFRHKAIIYDFLVFTNLSPEHLGSHGNSFEKYKKAKGQVFAELNNSPQKNIAGLEAPKTIIVNQDDSNHNYFLSFPAAKKLTYGFNLDSDYIAQKAQATVGGVDFTVNGLGFHLDTLGVFNVYNALPAIIIGDLLGLSRPAVQEGLANIKVIPGRMEPIDLGQDFLVLVDYAHEQKSMSLALQAGRQIADKNGQVIVLLGAEGGGRDKSKRGQMGQVASQLADYVVVSNVDPYSDSPGQIIQDIALAAEQAGKKREQNLFTIEDRRQGIKKALSLARKGDVVLITGKGAEQCMIVTGKTIPWDDRKIVTEELKILWFAAHK
jgi:UDP-N-acetylmuramoyl-L-alanyl-D-glutamate--2,6-diaminopimelate ligase